MATLNDAELVAISPCMLEEPHAVCTPSGWPRSPAPKDLEYTNTRLSPQCCLLRVCPRVSLRSGDHGDTALLNDFPAVRKVPLDLAAVGTDYDRVREPEAEDPT